MRMVSPLASELAYDEGCQKIANESFRVLKAEEIRVGLI